MKTPAESPSTPGSDEAKIAIRGPEIGPAQKRDMLLQRVRAARKRLSPIPGAVARLR
jgi:hypothetical protein